MTSHHEIIDFIENIRAEIPPRLHHVYEEAVDRALEEQHRRGRDFAHQIIKHNPMIRREFEQQQQEEGILAIFVLLIGFLGGVALMYLFDPDRGEQRRAALLGQAQHLADEVKSEANSVVQQAESTVKDAVGQADKAVDQATDQVKSSTAQVRNQASKAVSSASGAVKEAAGQVNAGVSDATLTAQVRAAVATGVRSPGAVEVSVAQGVVTLKGQVQASEAKGLVEKVQAISGVKSVENRLEIHDAAPTTPGGTTSGNNNTPR